MKKLLVLAILAFSIISLVYASTTINIKTVSYGKVGLFILAVNSIFDVYDTYHAVADYDGIAQINLTTDHADYVDLKFQVDGEDGTNYLIERMEDMKLGSTLWLKLLPGDISKNNTPIIASPVVNISENQTNVTSSVTSSNSTQQVTGFSITEIKDYVTGKWKYALWIVLSAIIIAGIALFIIKKPKFSAEPKVIKAVQEEKPNLTKLEETEKKLQEAQREIAKMKNQERIKAIEERIRAEREEIDKLEKGF